MRQERLFDGYESAKARDEAQKRVAQATDPEWIILAREGLRSVCKLGELFTSDDVWLAIGDAYVREPRAMGPVMSWGKHEQLCAPTELLRNSNFVSNHRRPQRLWMPL
jgi:hypothetical protein